MIKKDSFVPDTTRSEIVTALKELNPGESLLISPVEDRTRQRVYTAASRLRIPIRTKTTSVGLRVWLKSGKAETLEVEEVPLSKKEKLENLRRLMNGEIPATPEEVCLAIDASAGVEKQERVIVPFEDV